MFGNQNILDTNDDLLYNLYYALRNYWIFGIIKKRRVSLCGQAYFAGKHLKNAETGK
jgi:hypothetical protein